MQQPFHYTRHNRIFKQEKITTYILNFDQEKTFDKDDRNYMFKCLEKMNYSVEYIQFIKIVYQENTHKYKTMDTCRSVLNWKGA